MLRKRKENIFPHLGRQVHEVSFYGDGIFPLQGQIHRKLPQFHVQGKGPQTSPTLAFQVEGELPAH